jgi:hypothetical protein
LVVEAINYTPVILIGFGFEQWNGKNLSGHFGCARFSGKKMLLPEYSQTPPLASFIRLTLQLIIVNMMKIVI